MPSVSRFCWTVMTESPPGTSGDVVAFVDYLGLLTFAALGNLGLHLPRIPWHCVAVPVNGLHMAQGLLAIAAVSEPLGVVSDSLHKQG